VIIKRAKLKNNFWTILNTKKKLKRLKL